MITTFLRVPSFITTLGMLFFLNGITLHLLAGTQVFMPGGDLSATSSARSRSSTCLPELGVLVGARTDPRPPVRAHVDALGTAHDRDGGNLIGAAESGVNVRAIKIGNFVLANLLAGFAGILDSTRITTPSSRCRAARTSCSSASRAR